MHNTLHILTNNQWPTQLTAITASNNGNGIILINEAVYLVTQLLPTSKIYILEADWLARGGEQLPLANTVELINYHGFVDLCVKYQRSVTWK